MAEQELIDARARVTAFVADAAVQAAIAAMATKNYDLFKRAKSSEELIMASARATLLDDFINELQITIDKGDVARIQRDSREHRERNAPSVPVS